jgi:amino acid adenylation domain-containing protein
MDISRKTALINSAGERLTFGEHNSNVSEVINVLRSMNVQSGSKVAVLLRKSFEAVAVIQALRKEKITYIPLDRESPYERISKIIGDCNPDYIIHDGHFEQLLTSEDCNLKLPFGESVILTASNKNKVRFNTNDNTAYILYTSGSTGSPKGVAVSEAAAEAFVNWCISTFNIHSDDVVASISPFHFDLSVCDLFASRKTGATLLLLNKDTVSNPRMAVQCLNEHKATIVYATPSFFTALMNYGKAEKYHWSEMRTILFAGEVFHPKILHALMRTMNGAMFYNLYGPTETNVCTFHKIELDENRIVPYPIGKPCEGHQYEITSEGELLIGGLHVADGYHNQSELTAERFFYKNNLRWFRTGDLVRRENDVLVYSGRIDRMIKRKGYRIEPGEIESAALQINKVTAAACFAKHDTSGEIKIVLVCEGAYSSDQIRFRSELLNFIPDYMLPDLIVINSTIPLTSTGKTDYAKLISSAQYF